jgi:hypothetical protein
LFTIPHFAPKSFAQKTEKNKQVTMSTSRRLSPCPTRNTAVLELSDEVVVFPNLMEKNCSDFHQTESFNCIAISCHRDFQALDKTYFHLRFWNEILNGPIVDILVKAPESWTAKIYLSALHTTIKLRKVIVVYVTRNSWGSVDGPFATLNEVHWLYAASHDTLLSIINSAGCFLL